MKGGCYPVSIQRHAGPEIISTLILIVSISNKPATISINEAAGKKRFFKKTFNNSI
jgi:hypothetical protein